MEVPSPDFSVNDVMERVGEDHVIHVLQVATQETVKMKFKEFAKYYNKPASSRRKLLNVISLEVSEHSFEDIVRRPEVVNSLDWIDLCWPKHLRWRPQVKKYCLMSVQGCFTDFHVDFGGTSVWYHVVRGRKMFWLIRPTEENLKDYEDWLGYHDQEDVFFPDLVEECQLVTLERGNTFMIPSGWIHGVYTPEDSLVFGGNFLHSLAMPTQIRIARSEAECRVDVESRFPHLDRLLWYVLDRYAYCLTGASCLSEKYKRANHVVEDEEEGQEKHLTRCELAGLEALTGYLSGRAGTESCKVVGIQDLSSLLKRADRVIADHRKDDEERAITGRPVVFWKNKKFNILQGDPDAETAPPIAKTEDTPATDADSMEETDKSASAVRKSELKSRDETTEPAGTSKKSETTATGGTAGTGKKRARRCGKCDACTRADCQVCVHCRDMKKYGGPGVRKQCCIHKKCMNR